MLKVALTENHEDSKYRGEVTILLKDAVMEPSEANQALLEFKRNLLDRADNK